MKAIVMKKMNVMALEKQLYLMEILMKVNIKTEKDMELVLIDFPILHVMLVSILALTLIILLYFFLFKKNQVNT